MMMVSMAVTLDLLYGESQAKLMHRLDGSIVWIITVFTPNHKNRSIRNLTRHNCAYAYASGVEVVHKRNNTNNNADSCECIEY